MKKIAFIPVILLITAAWVYSGDIFFPVKKGMVQLTANFNSNNKIEGFSRLTVKDVVSSGSDITVIYSIQILDKNRKPSGKSGEREYSINISDGVLMYRLDNMMDAFFSARDMKYTIASGDFPIPSDIIPGMAIEDTWMKMTVSVPIIGTVTADTAITNIVCTGIETITVAAGTFEAYKVTQTSTTKTTGWGRSPIISTTAVWYAKGIGLVKSVSYNAKGKTESSSELYEIE